MKKVVIKKFQREQIKALAGYGMRDCDIAKIVGLAEATMQRHCKEELALGRALAKSNVTQTAYRMAISGKQPAMTMFWLKTQCRWKETIDLENMINTTTESLAEKVARIDEIIASKKKIAGE